MIAWFFQEILQNVLPDGRLSILENKEYVPGADRHGSVGHYSELTKISRRQFLRGGGPSPLRPPWALPEEDFLAACNGCGVCIAVCPQKILEPDSDNFPQVNFFRGECTFCGKCAVHCGEGAVRSEAGHRPWPYRARIEQSCLAVRGIPCHVCGDECPDDAIRFEPRPAGIVRVEVQSSVCNGCGACVRGCPVKAIRVVR